MTDEQKNTQEQSKNPKELSFNSITKFQTKNNFNNKNIIIILTKQRKTQSIRELIIMTQGPKMSLAEEDNGGKAVSLDKLN